MTDVSIVGAGASVLVTGALGWFAKSFVIWLKSRNERHNVDRTVDAQLQEHWTQTTLELVETLRTELHEAKAELEKARLAHLEEALDHIHALLASGTDAERNAAERRARAFLRRMRGDDRKGDMRNELQTEISAQRLKDDLRRDDEGKGQGNEQDG